MDMLFLGTSSGTPTRARNVSALALLEDSGSGWCLVDCGEATQHQLLRTRLSLHALQAICITHVHGDHCYGLPGLLASAGLQGRKQPLAIAAPRGVEDWIRSTQELTQLHLPFELEFFATESLAHWRAGNWLVDAIPLSHRVPSFGYSFTEARREARLDIDKLEAHRIPRGPIWGSLYHGCDVVHEGRTLRSEDYLVFPYPVRRIVVGGDNDRPELLADACRGTQVLVHEATYTREVMARMGESRGHSTAAAVAAFAQSAGVPNLLLTHFSPRYQADAGAASSIESVRAEALENFRGQLFLAEDFARFRLDKTGMLSRVG
jgi:ribonuclease Z